MAVSLELQHGVDDVFEHPWPRQATFLGDVPHEHDRHAALLCLVDQPLCAAAHLSDTAGQRRETGIGHCLDRVDHHELGVGRVDGVEDVRQGRFGVQPEIVSGGAQTLGASLDLLRTLLGGDVQGGATPRREQLQQQRALADARLATQQGDRTGHQATAEHPIELGEVCGDRVAVLAADVADACGSGTG